MRTLAPVFFVLAACGGSVGAPRDGGELPPLVEPALPFVPPADAGAPDALEAGPPNVCDLPDGRRLPCAPALSWSWEMDPSGAGVRCDRLACPSGARCQYEDNGQVLEGRCE